MKKSFLPLVMLIVISVFLGACSNTKKSASSEEITMVWYPNESGNDLKAARDEIGKVIEEATGKK